MGPVRTRLQAAVARGLTRFVGRDPELDTLKQALARAGAGHGQVVALVGEAGVGSRLVYEFLHAQPTQGMARARQQLGVLWQGDPLPAGAGPAQRLLRHRQPR